ncbi:precorrin-6Y C5,15-methyltransferase (decarboxylating) subunit CbiT [Candidatus Ventrimonas sp. KK005]
MAGRWSGVGDFGVDGTLECVENVFLACERSKITVILSRKEANGIMKDSAFIRGKIPMTKSEVRAVSLSKLNLRDDSIVYDIGAGTGSVAVEAALVIRQGHVYAIEEKEEGCQLIGQNVEKFHLENVTVVCGKAPDALKGLPVPDRVFVGGSGGRMAEILDFVRERNPLVQIVINVAALETLSVVGNYLKEKNLEGEIVSIQVAKAQTLGSYHLMQGQNPVYIVTIEPE